MTQLSEYKQREKKTIGGGRFSKVYLQEENDKYVVKKIIAPQYAFEKKLLDEIKELTRKLDNYCDCIKQLGINYAEVIMIEEEQDHIVMTQEYIDGYLLKEYIKHYGNIKELGEYFHTIFRWINLLKENNENYRIDLNLNNFILRKNNDNTSSMDVVLVDLCPVFDVRNDIVLDNLFEKNLYRMKMDLSCSIEMMITYAMKDLIEESLKSNLWNEIEWFYHFLLDELEKNSLILEFRKRINNAIGCEDDCLIPDIRMWAIDRYMNHQLKKEELDDIFSSSSITQLRELDDEKQERYIKDLKGKMQRLYKEGNNMNQIQRNIKEKINNTEWSTCNIPFRSGNICCYSELDIAERQNEVLRDHYIAGDDEYIFYKIFNCIDSDLFSALSKIISSEKPIGPVRAFREHTNTQLYYKYKVNEIEVFSADHWKGVYVVRVSSTEYVIVTESEIYFQELYCVYVVRELLNRSAENKKLLLLHGAAVNVDNYGLLIVGSKGAGKTTFVSKLSESDLQCEMISNDRTYTEIIDDEIRLHYYPLKFRFGFGTIRAIPDLKDFMSRKYQHRKPEKVRILLSDESCKSKFSLTLGEYQRLFKKKVVRSGNLSKIVIPQIVMNSDELEVVDVSKEEAREILGENNFTPHDDLFLDPWLMNREASIHELESFSKQQIEKLLDQVSVVKVRYGTNISSSRLKYCINSIVEDIKRKEH